MSVSVVKALYSVPRWGTEVAEAEDQTDTEVDRAVLREGGERVPMQRMTKEKVPLLTARHLAVSA